MAHQATRPGFTGQHMAAVMVSFFGIVIIVNVIMARLAGSTFGGVVVENSYVASQQFNHWLAQERSETALGWHTALNLDARRHVVLRVTPDDGRLTGFVARGTAHHPLGQAPDRALAFATTADGTLVSTTPLPVGRWQLQLVLGRAGQQRHLAADAQ
jgi:nitrogen fixation protein FixH